MNIDLFFVTYTQTEGNLRGFCCRAWSLPAVAPWSSGRGRSDRPGAVPCFRPERGRRDGGQKVRIPPESEPSVFPGHLILGVDVGASLYQQFDRLAEAVPGHLVQRRVAVLPTGSDSRLVIRCPGALMWYSVGGFYSFYSFIYFHLTQKHNHPHRDNNNNNHHHPVSTFLCL